MNSRGSRLSHRCAAGCIPFAVALVAFWVLSGCQAASSSSPSTSHAAAAQGWVSLERTSGALREAPVYLVTLYEDGGVLFEGRANVRSKGTFAKHIPPERAAVVFARLDAIDFWNREPRYDEERESKATGESLILRTASRDLPWDTIAARRHNRFKRIDGLFFAPRELIDLKILIEQTVDLAAWINGTPGEKPE